MTFEEAEAKIASLVARRLNQSADDAAPIAAAFLSAVLDQAVAGVESATLGPTSLSSSRTQLVEHLAHRLERLPSVRELSALLRVTETTARTIHRNVLAVSDRAMDMALKSVFERGAKNGLLGRGGAIPRGRIWKLASRADLDLARQLLEARSVKFVTQKETDGDYEMVVDPTFDPGIL